MMDYLALMKQHPDAGQALRVSWSDALCARISRIIAQESPQGIGHWDGLGDEHLKAPADRLLEALARWEETGREEDKWAARRAAARYYYAWQQAVKQWTADQEVA
jgi:hypothetical protein